MSGYDSIGEKHKVGTKIMCHFVEKLLRFEKYMAVSQKGPKKKRSVMLKGSLYFSKIFFGCTAFIQCMF